METIIIIVLVYLLYYYNCGRDGTRTRDRQLIRLLLYRLSYTTVHSVGFEPTKHYALELKSNPFDRSGNCVFVLVILLIKTGAWCGIRTHEALRIRS